ncbi:PIN2/TERF1-interacting telomerase inhibitor 1 isoform X2 [Drosophila kikkawai]|uniref:PIN2/TERF1-interacting telomerase inhibitor 1 isoform X2 n=1 Tax=Drosophila kikkawai TaxID=30033 RepID=A0A6P4IQT9_DROKI|nr:PIN2/TERF1-interacting telomerase inhibitor 1 isoform X2 [Drosophila kikkawai]
MAMLAEPRRRKRYNLCPRGKALYEDDNRFGTKMLEKMGWSKGNGLGARQDGEKDFVRIRFKNDAEGLGYEARDDQWTTHEEGFNGLLKSLNGGEDDKEANGKASESEEEARPMGFGFKAEEPEEPSKKKLKENISGMSLEERSKQSKARVHYQKFTRGKDLSRYSEKDLANIFGKKATEDIVAPVVVEEPKEEKKDVSPNFGGVQTVSTGLSVSDYFKQKMEAMKNRLKNGTTPVNGVGEAQVNGSELDVEEGKAESVSDEPIKKKKKKSAERVVETPITEPKKKKKSKRSSQDEAEKVGEEACEEQKPVEEEETIAKKKKKKSKSSSQDEVEEAKEEACVEPKPLEDEEAAGKKKKKKYKSSSQDGVEEVGEAVEDVEAVAKKKKKNKKDKADKIEETPETLVETIEILDEPAPKKKKSKKTELIDSEIILIDDNSNSRNESEAVDELARKKKSKKCEENQLEAIDTNEISEGKENPPKKKKKSKQEPEDAIQTDSNALDSTEKSSKKKKKAKTSDNEPVPKDAPPQSESEPTSVAPEPSFKKIKDKGRKHIDTDNNSKCSR